MHMRTKKWAKPELAVCPYFTDEPETRAAAVSGAGLRKGRFHRRNGEG